MTLDESIKHEEKIAEEQEELYRLCPASESVFHCDGTKDCKTLKNGKNKGCIKCAEEHRQLAEWLKDYKQLLEQEPCDDYNCISRQAVLDTLNKMDKALDDDRSVESYKKLLTECYKDLPPVIPIPKKKEGKWMQAPDTPNWYWCSECGCYRDSEHDEGLLKYCPNCGAKMEVEE